MPLSYYRGCWHEIGRDLLLNSRHNPKLSKEFYNQNSLHHSRDITGSSFRPLSKIPHCCRSKASGPCLSPSVADHPLKSAKDLWLGRLLPCQLPNPTQAHLTRVNTFQSFSFPWIKEEKEYYSKFRENLKKKPLSWTCEADSHALLTRSLLFNSFTRIESKRSTCMC